MTGVGEKKSGVSNPVAEPRPLWFALVAVLLTLPILAHGCHRGDHDDEPAVFPADRHAAAPEMPPHPAP